MTDKHPVFSDEWLDELDADIAKDREISDIKDRLEMAMRYNEPIAITPQEAEVLLSNLKVSL